MSQVCPYNEKPKCYRSNCGCDNSNNARRNCNRRTGAASLLVQSASATTDVTMTATSVGGEQEAVNSTNTTTNNISNALLGDVFMIVEYETAGVNPINETYIETSTLNNVTIMPPSATTGTTINATETVNATVNILPNGLALDKGQSLIVTEGDDGDSSRTRECYHYLC